MSEAAIAEKKISILEQALKHHPGSDQLLLALLTAAEVVLSPDDMLERCFLCSFFDKCPTSLSGLTFSTAKHLGKSCGSF